ncbi:MAG: SLC13 family permease [Anaerolineae bacterium]
MTFEIAFLLFVVAVALVLFSLELLPEDLIAMSILIALPLAGLLPPEKAFAGFGSETVVMIFGLLIMTAALVRTGVADDIGKMIVKVVGEHHGRLQVVIMVTAALLSTFMSNTASTALFVPVTLELARRLKVRVSKLLMPLAFAAILASSITLIGTSTNLVISGLMTGYHMEPLGMFELAPVGIPVLGAGLLYMIFLGPHLIPSREPPEALEERDFGIYPYLAEIVILPTSPLVGKTLDEAGLGKNLDLTVLRVVRNKRHYLVPRPNLELQASDELLVEGLRHQILRIKDIAGIGIKADVKLSDPRFQTENLHLAEAIVLPGSPLIGRTLKSLRFRQRYGLQVLGINRRGETVFRKLSQTPLQIGDQLLVQGRRSQIQALDADNTLHVIGSVRHEYPDRKLAPVALGAFGMMLVLSVVNVLSLPMAVLVGTLITFLTGCITPEEAYREITWRVLIVIGSMLALGAAMESTGAAEYLASYMVGLIGDSGPLVLLSTFFFLSLLLTQPMSNQAAAVLVVPIAIQTAQQLGLNPRTFAVMIAVGASCSFITPLEPACLMVYGPGHYRFTDFTRVGLPLTLIVYLISIIMVPWIWPL